MSLNRWVVIVLLIHSVAWKAMAAGGMAFDPAGNLYLLGANPSTIFKFSSDGTVKKFAQASSPEEDWTGLAVDGQGNVFVATDATGRNGDVITRVLKFTSSGKKSVYIPKCGDGQARAVAIDRSGNLFVSVMSLSKPRGPDVIYKFAPQGQRKSVFTKEMKGPTLLAFDNAGNVFVYEEDERKVSKLAADGKKLTSVTSGDVYDLACDAAGNLFVALPHINQIEKIASDGTKTTFAADVDPWFLAIDKDGNVFTLDDGIQKISPDGKRTKFAANPINN